MVHLQPMRWIDDRVDARLGVGLVARATHGVDRGAADAHVGLGAGNRPALPPRPVEPALCVRRHQRLVHGLRTGVVRVLELQLIGHDRSLFGVGRRT